MPSTTAALRTGPEIGLSGATYLGLGLAALRAGDQVRAVEAFASIDSAAWSAILDRFPHLANLIEKWEMR
jgi:hypothetical protein